MQKNTEKKESATLTLLNLVCKRVVGKGRKNSDQRCTSRIFF